MSFIFYRWVEIRKCKIDWDVAVTIDDDVRAALHPHDPERLRVGRLRRPFKGEAPSLGRRSAGNTGSASALEIEHEKGALVFAYADESMFLIEAP